MTDWYIYLWSSKILAFENIQSHNYPHKSRNILIYLFEHAFLVDLIKGYHIP
jgi:hypothetical protein